MSLQEIFDKCAKHLLTQNKKSMTSPSVGVPYCAYRGDNGLKCAAGIFITEEEYKPELEGFNSNDNNVSIALRRSGFPETNRSWILLMKLQSVHDAHEPCDWKNELRQVANYFSLNTNVLKEFS